MTNRLFLTAGLLLATTGALAVNDGLKGFMYGAADAPSGNEWQSVEELSLNKEQPHAWFFPFEDVQAAKKVLPENSSWWLSLNGDWQFHWAPVPEERPEDFYRKDFDASSWDRIPVPSNWNIIGLQQDGSQKYGTPIYVNQPVIFYHKVEKDDWRGGVMRTPPENWTVFKARNEVGSYRRTFTLPENWKGREVFINFDGVDSFFYLWINGRYVGFSKNSRNAASFNITDYLVKGENLLAVEVYRNSDGSFLEAQDMFRLPGIFRTVSLVSKAPVHLRDLVAEPDLDADYVNAQLKIRADVRNLSASVASGYSISYSLYANELYGEASEKAAAFALAEVPVVAKNAEAEANTVMYVQAPNKWSAEQPWRYTLVAQLRDAKGRTVETASTVVGFRKIEIRDTEAKDDEYGFAGRYFYINGKAVKLKGVDRHETHPAFGHAITRGMMEEDIMLMKRANINHVRNSHYPDDPYWYWLCDRYGIYLVDEANVESHEYYYGEASLSHPVEWENAHVARALEMVHANINHPSVVIWSLGNEAGPGRNFKAAYDAVKKADMSRPVHYERNNDCADFGSNMYPSIAWVRKTVRHENDLKYPYYICEYAHSMGNACGNLLDYWKAIESSNHLFGAAIWDWVDQALYNWLPDGTRYEAYGGDFGDTPNDGQFVMNGILFADKTPKPQYYEVKRVYQNVAVSLGKKNTLDIFNKNFFTGLDAYNAVWQIYGDGVKVAEGTFQLPKMAPRSVFNVAIPDPVSLKDEVEYFLKVQFLLKEDMPWAEAGYVQMEEQLPLKTASGWPDVAAVCTGDAISVSTDDCIVSVKGNGFTARFNNEDGSLYSLEYGGKSVIKAGCGPKLDAFRAYTNNDNWFNRSWYANGLHNLKHRAVALRHNTAAPGGTVELVYTVESQAPNAAEFLGGTASGHNSVKELTDKPFGKDDFKFITEQTWTVYPDGSIELRSEITSNKAETVLPRLGYLMRVPEEYSDFTYYGRGPECNYNDRKTSADIELYCSSVAEQMDSFPKPQEMGNHEQVRWCALTHMGRGVQFIALSGEMSVQALPYSAQDMTLAAHPYQLPEAGDTYLRLDLGVTGLGGNSCGQGGPLEQDRIFAGPHNFSFLIRPVSAGDNLTERAKLGKR